MDHGTVGTPAWSMVCLENAMAKGRERSMVMLGCVSDKKKNRLQSQEGGG